MKKLCTVFLALALLTVFAYSAGSNFSLKIGGGLEYVFGGEINDFLKDYPVYIRTHENNVSDDLAPVHFGPSFSLEAIYNFSQAFSLGLSVGFGSAWNRGSIHREYGPLASPIIVDETFDPKIRYVPLLLSGYYTLALDSKWAVVLGGGVGFHWVSFNLEESVQESRPSGLSTYDAVFRYSRGALGAQASVALEMNISSFLSVFISGCLRLASASGFVGKDEEEWMEPDGPGSLSEPNQTFWIYTYLYDGTEYTMYHISDEKSAEGPIIYNVHEGKVDISGAILTIGSRIKL